VHPFTIAWTAPPKRALIVSPVLELVLDGVVQQRGDEGHCENSGGSPALGDSPRRAYDDRVMLTDTSEAARDVQLAATRRLFNVIDQASGWKVDFIVRKLAD
jgi:hypothetical protein